MPASKPSWRLFTAWHRLADQFRTAWKHLPQSAWRSWLYVLTFGWIGSGLLVAGLTWLTRFWADRGLQALDEAWLQALLEVVALPVSAAVWMNLPGYAFFSIPVVVTAAVFFVRAGQPLWALSMLASYFMVAVVIGLGWWMWARPRPELVLGGALAPGFNSFPSGHIAQAVPVYGLLAYYWMHRTPRWGERVLVLLLLIGLLGSLTLGRLLLGTHWPSDVAAGAVIGLVWLGVLVSALRRAEYQRGDPGR